MRETDNNPATKAEYTVAHDARRRKPSKRIVVISAIMIIVALAASGVILYIHDKDNGPLPSSVEKSASFPLYYPSPLPVGYVYKSGSAKNEGGIIFYTLQSNSRTINVSEQAAPANPPDLTHLPGFTTLQTFAGSAAIGSSLGRPVALILSNTTLITITGQKNIPSDVVTAVAKAMTSLPQ